MSRLAKKALPSVDYLNERVEYNELTGELKWKERPRSHFKNLRVYRATNTKHAGRVITATDRLGYIKFEIDYVKYTASRIIWKLITGKDPVSDIDHINGIRSDNRKCNLRECTHSENMRNQGMRKTNSSGLKGAFLHRKTGKYTASIRDGEKLRYLGIFETKKLAHEAYCNAAIAIHGSFTRVTS